MFNSLDEVDGLSDEALQTLLDLPLKTGSKSDMPFHGMPSATAEDNVPNIPGSKPPGRAADDPRAKGFPQYVPRPLDVRIIGSKVQGIQTVRGTICVRNPYSWGD